MDLSVPVTAQTPVYPGDPEVRVDPVTDIDSAGYRCHRVSLGTHAGTHVDAPSHMVADGAHLDRYPVERFVGRGRYIDARGGFALDTVQQAGIAAGDITCSHRYGRPLLNRPTSPTIRRFPGHAEYSRMPRSMVGVDMCSVDYEPIAVHQTLLRGDVLILENLTGLERVAGRDFRVYALPLRLAADGAPVRVVAELS